MDLTQTVQFVARCHMTAPPTSMTYANIVSLKNACVDFLLATLNDMYILTGDIVNTYLNVYTSEKIFYYTGPEWGPSLEGTICVIIHGLYGLKTSANTWCQALCHALNRKMGFEFSLADNDV